MTHILVNNEYQNYSRDQINKTYKACGCIFISELDVINNIINDKYIQLCKIHHLNYIHQNSNNNTIHQNLNYIKTPKILNNYKFDSYINFGRYKNKSFTYVFQQDKLYCYNLAFWNNHNSDYNNKNININLFIQFIKNQISINDHND